MEKSFVIVTGRNILNFCFTLKRVFASEQAKKYPFPTLGTEFWWPSSRDWSQAFDEPRLLVIKSRQ